MSYREVRFRVLPTVIADLGTDLANEIAARSAGDTAVGDAAAAALAVEASARGAADTAAAAALADEVVAREAADDAEAQARVLVEGKNAAQEQALEVLVGSAGALEIAQVPGSSNMFVYTGTVQTLS